MTATPAPEVDPAVRGVSVRLFREGDEERMLLLLEQAFGRWPSLEITVDPIDHLRWKLRAGVYRNHVVAEAGQKIAGMAVTLPRTARAREHALVEWIAVDLAVHPDYQRLGILNAIRKVREESFCGAFDFAIGGLGDHPVFKHRTWLGDTPRRLIGNRVQVRERPFTLAAALARFGPRPGRSMRDVARSIGLAWRGVLGLARGGPPVAQRTAWTVREIDSFDERVDRLWEEASPSFDFVLLRDAEFLNWRYCDARAGRFTRFAAEQDGRLLGYAVAQVSYGRGYLSDVLVRPGRLDVLDSLLAHATGRLKQAGVAVAIAWCATLHPYGPVLQRHGWLVRPTRTRDLSYRPLHRGAETKLAFLQDPQTRIHFTTGDVDVV